ncbi:undecaprenyl/decaprenyl-phosphate alpha-N-acetylglucosaminyl 1-phosphate transferase [Aeoliella sp. ICT_H6.2]|uniref:Undecaprenyl/decaprenyl-phosphate alpha-N-acetylglucosaminyl 1-phosphate transferase n=1 Tax=Aeoliella straminimaris TaxID=2954799 RepID=A0A9X2FBB0_9BACT|nr:MraY family glycosyltransferase [Aeoliella straminimaris]MCO6044962.1 undecaprenyl/decaprenyl-phosphate alpha-N-acetylglucosaminyl 1-phosphate transferase [Aeoliella straminimaris]
MLDSTTLLYLIAGVGSCVMSLILTPVVRETSKKLGFVDRPDQRRKAHKAPVALGGGAAVFLSMVITMVIVFVVASLYGLNVKTPWNHLPLGCLAIGATAIVALGLLDDLKGMRGRYKLLGQLAIAGLLIWSGVRIEGFTAFGYPINLGWFAIPGTLFWLVGTTNAVNLIDGIDGLAGGVGFILCITLAAICGWQGNVAMAAIVLALSGALLGFLRYNFAPATIYLGDAGSMLVGLVCGTIAVLANGKSSAAMAFAVPIAVWSIPILDSFAALLRRKLTGRSMFAPDRGHLHHSLLVRGWTVQQASLFIALICATTCLSAVLSIYLKKEWIALVTVAAVMVFLVSTKTFGHIEFALLKGRMSRFANSLATAESANGASVRESSLQLQGSREWNKLWTAIIEAADTYHLTRIKLSIDIPLLHESFYATWDTSRNVDSEATLWRLTHPLVVDDQQVGQMDITGETMAEARGSTLNQIGQVLDFLEPIEEDIRYIRENIKADDLSMRVSRVVEHPLIGPTPAGSVTSPTDSSLIR